VCFSPVDRRCGSTGNLSSIGYAKTGKLAESSEYMTHVLRITRKLFLCCIFFSLIQSGLSDGQKIDSSEYFLCEQSKGGHPISVPKEIICRIDDNLSNQTVTKNITVWVPISEPQITTAVKCFNVTRKIFTDYSLLLTRYILSDQIFYEAVPAHECKKAWKSKTFRGKNLTEIAVNTFSTNYCLKVKYSYCCYAHCNTVTNFVLQIGTLVTYDGKSVFTSLGDTSGCLTSERICTNAHHTLLWSAHEFS